MSKQYNIYIWKKAPFLRLILPVITGILLEFYFDIPIQYIIIIGLALIGSYIIYSCLPIILRFKFHAAGGIIITAFMINAGAFLTWNKDIRDHKAWYGNKYDSSFYIIATINEPLVEKNNSYKALATVDAIVKNDSAYKTTGKLLLYFEKDSFLNHITLGNRIIFKKDLQQIKNSGNPAAFNYARYSAFQQIFNQCYLKKDEWILLKAKTHHTSKRRFLIRSESLQMCSTNT